MIDHIVIGVRELARSRAFYEKVLPSVGCAFVAQYGNAAGFGPGGKPIFWIREDGKAPDQVHVAFAAGDRATVDAFHVAGLAAGGQDNGPPGIREIYHPDYYGAFVLDPDGHNVEVVCHAPG